MARSQIHSGFSSCRPSCLCPRSSTVIAAGGKEKDACRPCGCMLHASMHKEMASALQIVLGLLPLHWRNSTSAVVVAFFYKPASQQLILGTILLRFRGFKFCACGLCCHLNLRAGSSSRGNRWLLPTGDPSRSYIWETMNGKAMVVRSRLRAPSLLADYVKDGLPETIHSSPIILDIWTIYMRPIGRPSKTLALCHHPTPSCSLSTVPLQPPLPPTRSRIE
ncbi:hypothetical protein BS78_05G070800 [Paspalum vaginatum]|nr:hypothetical protein BS78_05G070800 [Paspalum vaginatum]